MDFVRRHRRHDSLSSLDWSKHLHLLEQKKDVPFIPHLISPMNVVPESPTLNRHHQSFVSYPISPMNMPPESPNFCKHHRGNTNDSFSSFQQSPSLPNFGSLIISVKDVDHHEIVNQTVFVKQLDPLFTKSRQQSQPILAAKEPQYPLVNNNMDSPPSSLSLRPRCQSDDQRTSYHRRDSFNSLPQPLELKFEHTEWRESTWIYRAEY